jgi:DNA-directed RNA polymerase III subunit RPC2
VGPPPEGDRGQKRFDVLDVDGIASPGERLEPGKVYINKQTPVNTTDTLANPENIPESGTWLRHLSP